ncbi:MAG TPA: SDR family NAD(P)-dependent oxidoreductase [Stellaceae bacterium]|nr:SDR family NAD(P)-dependent oxidoreductase [Stellaceae bacterium]
MARPVVVISGGSRGLGAGIVQKCLDAGYVVATFSRVATPFVDAEQRHDPHRERFHWAAIDSREDGALSRFVSDVSDHYGAIDALVNNAAIGRFGAFPLMRVSDLDDSIAVNLRSNILLARLCTPSMVARGSGSIVNISSVNAVRGNAGVAAYSATKAALDGFTRALARELGQRNIRVNSLAPGYFDSDMVEGLSDRQRRAIVRNTPLGRLGTIDEIAEVALFLLSPAAAFMTGQTIVIDGGLSC